MYQLKKGPFIHALGCVERPDFTVHTAMLPGGNLTSTITIDDNGAISAPRLSSEEMFEPLPKEVLKASGVARARNSAKSTIFAALVAQEFNRMLTDEPGYNPDRVIIGIANCSASAAISWEYEAEGTSLGWRNTNTMLMPSALPSAIGTQISAAIKTHNATITFLNDVLGMCAAVEYTYVNFFHDRADYAFLIASEELSVPHDKVRECKKNSLMIERDGASGLLLSKKMLRDVAWQLVLFQHAAKASDIVIPDAWKNETVVRICIPESNSAFSSLPFAIALQKLFNEANNKGILMVTVENRSTFAMGFQLMEK